jgi:hypothetical protein
VPVLVTGDNRRTAEAVARAVGIDEVHAQVLPQDKAEIVRRLQAAGARVAMVGDGINDAPALTQAHVGIAIGAGTDIAIESADVVLVGKRLGAVPEAITIGAMSYRKTLQNLSLAFSFNGIGVPIAATGLLHPAWAMAAMAASVTTVLANSFGGRLVGHAPKLPVAAAEPARSAPRADGAPIRIEVFTAPGCSRCAQAQATLKALAEALGPDRVSWREVDILAETDRAVELGVVSTPAIAIDGELVFPSLPRAERLREALERRLAASAARQSP